MGQQQKNTNIQRYNNNKKPRTLISNTPNPNKKRPLQHKHNQKIQRHNQEKEKQTKTKIRTTWTNMCPTKQVEKQKTTTRNKRTNESSGKPQYETNMGIPKKAKIHTNKETHATKNGQRGIHTKY